MVIRRTCWLLCLFAFLIGDDFLKLRLGLFMKTSQTQKIHFKTRQPGCNEKLSGLLTEDLKPQLFIFCVA